MGVTGVQNRTRQGRPTTERIKERRLLSERSAPPSQRPSRRLKYTAVWLPARRAYSSERDGRSLNLALMVSARRACHAEPQRFGPERPRERTVIAQTYLV